MTDVYINRLTETGEYQESILPEGARVDFYKSIVDGGKYSAEAYHPIRLIEGSVGTEVDPACRVNVYRNGDQYMGFDIKEGDRRDFVVERSSTEFVHRPRLGKERG